MSDRNAVVLLPISVTIFEEKGPTHDYPYIFRAVPAE